MSKKSRKRKSHQNQSVAALRGNGLRAFKKQDYAGAIEAWERMDGQTPNILPVPALAEAYFRLGLDELYGHSRQPVASSNVEAGLQALRQAVHLAPDDPCYAYHLGLAEQRYGNVDNAVQAYRAVQKSTDASANGFARRAAYPFALALLQQDKNPAQDPVWANLSKEEQTMLDQAQGFYARPYPVSSDAPPLWQGLAALGEGIHNHAQTALVRVAEEAGGTKQGAVAHYYLGVLAAGQKDWVETRRQWTAARAAGLASPWLEANMSELYHQLAEDLLQKEDLEDALEAANEAVRHKPGNKQLGELISQIYQQIGYQAASAGDWTAALEAWCKAQDAGGGSFRIAYNLALAYERVEDWIAAGETWREALRRRPRRADHPDAITDEQVARLWRRAAEAYHKAGEYEESANVYRQALKWNPDDIDTRMLLAEGLLSDGRLQAAENELQRILERDPNHIPALLRIGEVVVENGSWWRASPAPEYWKKVLELESDHSEARQLLADYFVNQAEDYLSWGSSAQAVELYTEALGYQPQNGSIWAALGGCYSQMGQQGKANEHIEQALRYAADDLNVYGQVIGVWLEQKDVERAKQILARAEAAVQDVPSTFYVIQAGMCIEQDIPDLARVWLDRAIEKATPDVPVFMLIGEMLVMLGASEMGHEYLERAIQAKQSVGLAYLLRGVLCAKDDDLETAERYWNEAEKVARKDRDSELKERVQAARMMFSMPQGLLNLLLNNPRLLDQGGPFDGMPFPFPGFFDDDEEDDDDDGFFV